jgi:hypothetical protein
MRKKQNTHADMIVTLFGIQDITGEEKATYLPSFNLISA